MDLSQQFEIRCFALHFLREISTPSATTFAPNAASHSDLKVDFSCLRVLRRIDDMLQINISHRSSSQRPMPARRATASSIYSKSESISTDAAQQAAQAAAALAFIRAQERSRLSQDCRPRRSDSSSQNGHTLHQQHTGAGSTMNVLRRRQSVRFVNRNPDRQRTTSSPSIQIRAEARPGFATIRPTVMAPGTPAAYRPVSPLSSFGKDSSASEVPESSILGSSAYNAPSIADYDVSSSQSVHYGVRKSRSMFMPLKPPDVFYTNGTPEKPPAPCYNYGNGISSVPMLQSQSRQIHLKTHKSMNVLGLMRSHSSSGGRLSNDLRVQFARDRFLHQTNQQRLRDRPSFLFRTKARMQEISGPTSSENGNDTAFTSFPEGISSWRESGLSTKARRAANRIKNRLRRVFGRSMRAAVDIPHQQVDAPETHVRKYTGTDVQESSSDTSTSSSPTRSDTQGSLGSFKNTTIRLVPPMPKRLPIYQFSQGHEVAQDVSYSESIYSRTTGNPTPEPAGSSLTLPLRDNRPITGSAVILDRVTYHLSTSNDKSCSSSCLDAPAARMSWINSEVSKPETTEGDCVFNTFYINNTSDETRFIACGHVRENPQINDDDTAVAQQPIAPIKQPLGELQHNARLNLEPMPILRPTIKTTSGTPLVENIDFNRPNLLPPPPPIQPSNPAAKLTSRRTVTPPRLPPGGLPGSPEEIALPGSLADIVMTSRLQDVSPRPSEALQPVSAPLHFQQNDRPVGDVHAEGKDAPTLNRSNERLWKLDLVPETWCSNETLRTMLVERGNIKRRISAMGIPIGLDPATGLHTGKTRDSDMLDIKSGRENTNPQAEDNDEDIYGAEGTGLMGPSVVACRNIQLVGSLLSSRRSRITGCSGSDSDEAFI